MCMGTEDCGNIEDRSLEEGGSGETVAVEIELTGEMTGDGWLGCEIGSEHRWLGGKNAAGDVPDLSLDMFGV